MLGLDTTARATATRCCWPPDICAGLTILKPGQPDFLAAPPGQRLAPVAGRDALHLHDEFDVLARGEHRDQVVGLEHETDLRKPELGEFALALVIDAFALDPDFAAVGNIEAADGIQQCCLAAAGWRRQANEAAGSISILR